MEHRTERGIVRIKAIHRVVIKGYKRETQFDSFSHFSLLWLRNLLRKQF